MRTVLQARLPTLQAAFKREMEAAGVTFILPVAMAFIFDRPEARVLWRRDGYVGHIVLFSDHLDETEAARLCAAIVSRVADKWVVLSPPSAITIRQPNPKWCGGGAERDTIDRKLRDVRDIAKEMLRDAGYKVR